MTRPAVSFHVVFDSGRWCVWKFGEAAPDARFVSKASAVANAAWRARQHASGEIIVENMRGEIEERRQVSSDILHMATEATGEYCFVRRPN